MKMKKYLYRKFFLPEIKKYMKIDLKRFIFLIIKIWENGFFENYFQLSTDKRNSEK